MCKPLAVWCILLLLCLNINSFLCASAQKQTCPVEYQRHEVESFRTGRAAPYLFGGIYRSGRPCVNCERGGLWSKFCSFAYPQATGAVHWDQQICSAQQTQQFVNRTLQLGAGAEMLQMTPCDLWQHLKGRTTWVVGDSMAKDLFRAVRCFLIEFQSLRTYHASNNYTAMSLLNNIPGEGQPWCVHMLEGTRLCQIHAVQGHLFAEPWHAVKRNLSGPGVLQVLHDSMATSDDMFILHFGLWHRKSRPEAYIQHLQSVGKFYASTRARFPNVLFMETPKQHFDSQDGDYLEEWVGKRQGPFTCQPVPGVTQHPNGSTAAEPGNTAAEFVVQGTWRNFAVHTVLAKQYGMPVLEIYNNTVTAWEFHRNNSQGKECSHYCFPSAPQLWVWSLKNALEKLSLGAPVTSTKRSKNLRGCATVQDRDEAEIGAPKSKQEVMAYLQQQQLHSVQSSGGNDTSQGASSVTQQLQKSGSGQGSNAYADMPAHEQVHFLRMAVQKLHSQNQYLLKLLQQKRQQTRRQRQRLKAQEPGY